MLEINNLMKKYKKVAAVDHISFTVPSGKVGILLGPNGAGKSTTIKSIAGLLRYEGEIKVNGLPSKSVDAKKVFAYIPEIPAMFGALTAVSYTHLPLLFFYQTTGRLDKVIVFYQRFSTCLFL